MVQFLVFFKVFVVKFITYHALFHIKLCFLRYDVDHVILAQHVRPSGFSSCWSHSLELTAR